jgi:UDP-N-acetylglucosamine--N-acetylmuramyl-(pentapeptide) pyrophosphoryl-undecaprenol N-acetylglucosamine transferase
LPSALSGATVLLAAGGTGGHLQPALAVAAEAQARGARVVVVTTPSQVERVSEQYQTYALELKGFERRVDVRAYARTFRLLAAAVPAVRHILKEARPNVAVGGGGFASGPVVAVAAASGIPGLALEADAHLGVANRLLRPFVRRFCLSFPHRRAGAAPVRRHGAAAEPWPARRDAGAGQRGL